MVGARGTSANTNVVSAFVFEVVATFLFLVCILGVTHPIAPTGFAGLAIGLTLVVIHLVGINITGTSVNPARSIGPALVGIASNPGAVAQLWLFIVAPLMGAGTAGLLFRAGAILDVTKLAQAFRVRAPLAGFFIGPSHWCSSAAARRLLAAWGRSSRRSIFSA